MESLVQEPVEVEGLELLPNNFEWGVSTSGHQQEGDGWGRYPITDWGAFERSMAGFLAKHAGMSVDYANGTLTQDMWDRIKKEATVPNNYVSGDAAGWWQGMDIEDLNIAHSDIGLNAIRFGVESGRLREGRSFPLDHDAINHYKLFLRECKNKRMKTTLTLFHYTNPFWMGSDVWEKRDVVSDFTDYTNNLLHVLSDEFPDRIIIINESEIYTLLGWILGERPPEKKNDFIGAKKVFDNLIEAHKRAYDIIKKFNPSILVSSAFNLSQIEPKYNHFSDRLGAKVSDFLSNRLFLSRLIGHMDFIAVNHYMHNVKSGLNPMSGKYQSPQDEPRSDMGWYLNPQGLYNVIISIRKYNLPVVITESGVADARDLYRSWYVRETVNAIINAVRDGVDIQGFYPWSLTDNFEWNHGFWPKFGFIAMDRRDNRKRIARPSASYYSKIIAEHKRLKSLH